MHTMTSSSIIINPTKPTPGVGFDVREADGRPGDPPAIVAGPDRLKNELGWMRRRADLTEIIESALAWEQALRGRIRKARGRNV